MIHPDVLLLSLTSPWIRFGIGLAGFLLIAPAALYIRYLRPNRMEARFAKERALTPLYLGLAVLLFLPGVAYVLFARGFPDSLVLGLYALSLASAILGAGLTILGWPRGSDTGER